MTWVSRRSHQVKVRGSRRKPGLRCGGYIPTNRWGDGFYPRSNASLAGVLAKTNKITGTVLAIYGYTYYGITVLRLTVLWDNRLYNYGLSYDTLLRVCLQELRLLWDNRTTVNRLRITIRRYP